MWAALEQSYYKVSDGYGYPVGSPGINHNTSSVMTSKITGNSTVYSVFVSVDIKENIKARFTCPLWRGIHTWQADSPHKRPVMQKAFSFNDIIMKPWTEQGSWDFVSSKSKLCFNSGTCIMKLSKSYYKHIFHNLLDTVFTNSCSFSLLWKTTLRERPNNLVVELYRFHCAFIIAGLYAICCCTEPGDNKTCDNKTHVITWPDCIYHTAVCTQSWCGYHRLQL